MFKKIRIAFLLFILLLVGAHTYLTHARLIDWDQPLSVVIYPVNADASPSTADHITGLSIDDYKPVERFMREQRERYGLSLADPVQLEIGPEVTALPPAPPFGENVIAIMLYITRTNKLGLGPTEMIFPLPQKTGKSWSRKIIQPI